MGSCRFRISIGLYQQILTDELCIHRVFAKMVLGLLLRKQKENCINIPQELLHCVYSNENYHCSLAKCEFIGMLLTWIWNHHYGLVNIYYVQRKHTPVTQTWGRCWLFSLIAVELFIMNHQFFPRAGSIQSVLHGCFKAFMGSCAMEKNYGQPRIAFCTTIICQVTHLC